MIPHKDIFIYQLSNSIFSIDQINVAIVLYIFIPDELGSNLGRIISYTDESVPCRVIAVFWDVTTVSVEHADSIFRVIPSLSGRVS
jgi:hypothetical protein